MEAPAMNPGEASARPSQEAEPRICGICEAVVSKRGLLDCCDHTFCFSCIEDWATVTNLCPMCKSQFKLLSLVNAGESGEEGEEGEGESTSGYKRTPDEAFSYFIDEEAVTCLEGDSCKLRGGQDNLEDTSVACDGCDRWYHACCVGFDPGKPCKTWHCPRCNKFPAQKPALMKKDGKKAKDVDDMSFSFTESGESAIVISMATFIEAEKKAEKEAEKAEKVQTEAQYLPVSDSRHKSSLDKLLEDLVKNGSREDDEYEEEDLEPVEEEEDDGQQEEAPEFDAEEEQQLEQEVQDIFKEAEEEGGDEEQAVELHDYMDVKNTGTTELNVEELVSDDGKAIKSSDSEKAPATRKPEPKKAQPEEKDGVRTRIIMKRETEEVSLAETIRQQVMADRGCSQLSNDQLLAAYKAAVVKKPASKPATKAPGDSAREKLKRKLYGGIRGRRVYDRDWDVSFWRDKVLGEKRRQAAPQASEVIAPVIRAEEPVDSIAERVCLADSSLLPKADGANPLPVKGVSMPKPGDKISLMKAKPKEEESKPDEAAEEAKDKRKWALELLARKNKQQVKVENHGLGKSFVKLAQLPADMRPVLEPNPRSKVPTAVRQMHLNRFAELYLKNVAVGRNQESAQAVNAALTMEKEISEKSNSKTVYVNLCVRALSRGDTPAKHEVAASQDSVNDALLAAGLISDSPPGSPEREPEKEKAELKVEPGKAEDKEIESPRKKARVEESSSLSRPASVGKEGIKALLEHLRREEVELRVQPEPASTTASDFREAGVESSEQQLEEQEEPQLQDEKLKSDAGEPLNSKSEDAGEPPCKEEAKVTSAETSPEFMDLDSRIDRVRSNIVQHMNETSGITEQIIRENAKLIDPHQKPSHRHSKPPPAPHQAKPNAPGSAPSSVQKQVEMYVKEHIRPLYKSGVIKGEQYQWTVSKTTSKVLQFHKDATSADFLIAEGSRVKKLAEQYLQRYAQEKQSGSLSR